MSEENDSGLGYWYKSDTGHDVDVTGYGRDGTYYGRDRSDSKKSSSSSASSGDIEGLGGLIVFGLVIYAIYRISIFVEANWTVIATVAGIIVACVILCVIFHFTARRAGLLTLITIILSGVLIVGAIRTGPRQLEEYYENVESYVDMVNEKIPPGKELLRRWKE